MIVRVACVAVFAGRAWQHLFWDAPFRALLWSQNTMEGVVKAVLGMDWESYASNPAFSDTIQQIIRGFGVFYALAAVMAAVLPRKSGVLRMVGTWMMIAGAVSLVGLAFLYHLDRMRRWGEFGEYACQFATPVLLVLVLHARWWSAQWVLRVAVAVAFACHGLYAVGYYPTPGEWVTMTMECLGVSDAQAMSLLRMAGVADFVTAALLLVPAASYPAFGYAAFWGGLTALARPWTFLQSSSLVESAHYWLWEFVVRWPHMLVPAAGLAMAWAASRKSQPRPASTETPPISLVSQDPTSHSQCASH